MKKIFNSILMLAAAGTLVLSCRPMDRDDHKLGPAVQESQLSFTATPSASTPNIIELSNTSSVKGVALWDLGNGTTVKGDKVSASYPFKGDYTITMSLYTTGGSMSTSKVVEITGDDYSLLDTPGYNALTGGAAATDGKTWVYARYTYNHFGVDDVTRAPNVDESGTPGGGYWWGCDPNGKSETCLYTQEYTFIQVGTKLQWKNNGYIYANENGMNHLGIDGTPTPNGDFDIPYVPKDNLTFSLNEEDMTLTLSDGAFMGFYTGVSEYHIVSLTEHKMVLWCGSAAEPGNAWYFIFVPKDELKEPEEEKPEPKPEPEEAWFRPLASTNLLRSSLSDYEQWWNGDLTAKITINTNISITVPDDVQEGEWNGQFKIRTHVPAGARERFDFSCSINSTQKGIATVKMTAANDPGDDEFFYDGNVEINAGETVLVEKADHMLYNATESILLIFDFGRFPAGSVITISDLCLQKHIPLSEKPEVVNWWPTANVKIEQWFSMADWSGGLTADLKELEGNGFEITIPEGIGGSEWQGQVKLISDIKLETSKEYELSFHMESTDASSYTVKLTGEPEYDPNSEEAPYMVSFYSNSLGMIAGETDFKKVGLSPYMEDANAAKLIFDFGRTPAGTVVKVTDIVLQEYIY